MRSPIALLLLWGAAAACFVACAGAPFALPPDDQDATTPDATTDAQTDGTSEDATTVDVRPQRDAIVADRDGGGADDADADAGAIDAGAVTDADSGDAAVVHCGSGFACAPEVPDGWAGPFALYAGPDASPACGQGFAGAALAGNATPNAPAASCGCACGPAHGVHCSSPAIALYASSVTCSSVGSSSCESVTLTPGACTTVDAAACGVTLGAALTLPASTPSQGRCDPVAAVDAAALTWSTQSLACAVSVPPPAADCPAGNVCAPVPGAPFRLGLCIEQAGNVACPAAGYNSKRVYYGGVDDERGCSPCDCDSGVAGATCSETLQQYQSTDGGCVTPQVSYLPGTCQGVQTPSDLRLTVTPSGGACAPSPSMAVGAATPINPMTFCCLP